MPTPAHEILHSSDAALLDMLTGEEPPSQRLKHIRRRDEDLDPLLLGAAANYHNITRNHYCHDFFPGVQDPTSPNSWDFSQWTGEQMLASKGPKARLTYVSLQAPRSERLNRMGGTLSLPPPEAEQPELLRAPQAVDGRSAVSSSETSPASSLPVTPSASPMHLPMPKERLLLAGDVNVKCMARTRVPTPHGPVFLHLYHNDQDNKEHMAIVVDPAQFDANGSAPGIPSIRSASLDTVWSENETPMDRLTRGAYVGRLGPGVAVPSAPLNTINSAVVDSLPAPLVRIHSECFTGETIGSQRCDCGEQLDEALRLISQPIVLPSKNGSPVRMIPGRGAIVYMRQEGRGIGLLEKIRAYNLQDMGHDTVSANLALGHGADERGYEIANAILRDLGLADGLRLLTNNPDKVTKIAAEGVRVVDRVPMVPRSWRTHSKGHGLAALMGSPLRGASPAILDEETPAGATLIGGGAVKGDDLEKYLRTKISRMGHMLSMPGDAMY
jgi:GTP cyclohydrolase II